MTYSILRLPEVIARTGLGRSTIYLYISKGLFPEPIRLGERAVGWDSRDVESWLESRRIASQDR